jgi:hypothetical protein
MPTRMSSKKSCRLILNHAGRQFSLGKLVRPVRFSGSYSTAIAFHSIRFVVPRALSMNLKARLRLAGW